MKKIINLRNSFSLILIISANFVFSQKSDVIFRDSGYIISVIKFTREPTPEYFYLPEEKLSDFGFVKYKKKDRRKSKLGYFLPLHNKLMDSKGYDIISYSLLRNHAIRIYTGGIPIGLSNCFNNSSIESKERPMQYFTQIGGQIMNVPYNNSYLIGDSISMGKQLYSISIAKSKLNFCQDHMPEDRYKEYVLSAYIYEYDGLHVISDGERKIFQNLFHKKDFFRDESSFSNASPTKFHRKYASD